jgi:LmbE family N-acetylglucosaminyl deacetylase
MKIFKSRKPKIHRYVLIATLAIVSIITAPRAQQTATTRQSPEDRVALYQALLDLANPWTVMCIAAHPDDEDGTSLIVMRRKYGAHTVSLFSTFGEGGQNAIGPELYEELGAIRARETMAASEIQGSEPYFLGLKDYGFSKTADEAFKIWGHEEALRRMVLQIRKLRPDVIITNHSVTNNDHGQHQATARLTVEAFDAAADPKRFPEQLKDGVTVWQAQRLFVRTGRASNPAPAETRPVVTIDPNERDPIRETVYAEEALRGLQKHATQGPWPKTFAEFAARFRSFTGQTAAPGQLPPIRYALVREAKGANALTKDSHNFVDGLQLPAEFVSALALFKIGGRPLIDFVDQPDRVLATLISASKSADSSTASRHTAAVNIRTPLQLFRERMNLAVARAAGIEADLRSSDGSLVVRDERAPLIIRVTNHGTKAAQLENAEVHYPAPLQIGPPGSFVRISQLLNGGETRNVKTLTPFYLENLLPSYLKSPWPKGISPLPLHNNAITVGVLLEGISISVPVNSRVELIPDVEIVDVTPGTFVSPSPGTSRANFSMRLVNNRQGQFAGRLVGYLLDCRGASCSRGILASERILLNPSETRSITIGLPAGPTEVKNPWVKTGDLRMRLPYEASFLIEENVTDSNPHWVALSKSSSVIVGLTDARVAPNLNVGYIRGFDYSLPNALSALGVESKELSVDDVKTADLQKYNAVIVDNRVYESTPGLIEANQKLLDYAKNGGTLIVFYHKSFEWNPDERRKRPQLAPYKLILGDERIVDQNAPITFLEPEHPLLNVPNKMGQEDFASWIQERGLYYPKEWDPQFHALLQSNDPGEGPLKGGLLVADYGRGRYIYTSMVWYRELRAGVPGAYRMLANIISYGAGK